VTQWDLHPATVHREVRWFIVGDPADDVRPSHPGRWRTDAYHLPSLTPYSCVKWRSGPRRLERKERIGRVELVRWCGVPGFAECWTKQRVPQRRRPEGAAWCDVAKDVWDADGIQIGRAVVNDEVLWTYCVDLDRAAEPSRRALGPWRRLLIEADPNSYAGFLTARLRGQPSGAIAS